MTVRTALSYELLIKVTSNGRTGPAEVQAWVDGKIVALGRADLLNPRQRENLIKDLAAKLKTSRKKLAENLNACWLETVQKAEAEKAKAAAGHPDAAPATKPAEKGPTAATRMVQMVREAGVELIHTPEQLACALVPIDGHRECWPLRSRAFRNWIRRLYYLTEGGGIGSQAVEDALGVLEGQAQFDGAECSVHVRLAEHEGRTYLDLGDASWRAVEIGPQGWQVEDSPPVLFRRPRGLLALPQPVRGGSLDTLRQLLNLEGEGDWQLIITWLLQSLRGTGSYPVLALAGEQGSCKSTAAKVLRSLIDPSAAPLRRPPREERDLMIAASNSWVIALDNLSHIPDWLSDLLCCLATGGGYSTRELYSDGEETIFSARRPCVLTSIEDVTTRGDLLDRAVGVTLPPLRGAGSERRRRAEREYLAAVDAARPCILGALLDAACAALAQLPHVHIEDLPRMADYAEMAVAAEQALGWEPGSFLRAYQGNRGQAHQVTLDGSLIYPPLEALLREKRQWHGIASELLQELCNRTSECVRRQKGWPGQPHVLSGQLRRLAPALAAVGIDILFPGVNDRPRRLYIRLQEQERKRASGASGASGDDAAPGQERNSGSTAQAASDGFSASEDRSQSEPDAPGDDFDAQADTDSDAQDPPENLDFDTADASDADLHSRSGNDLRTPWEDDEAAF